MTATAPTLDEQFQAFVDANPWVVTRLAEEALHLHRMGWKRLSIDEMFCALRHEAKKTSDPNSTFKMNNNYRSRMARLLMKMYPELDGAFEVRRLATEAP